MRGSLVDHARQVAISPDIATLQIALSPFMLQNGVEHNSGVPSNLWQVPWFGRSMGGFPKLVRTQVRSLSHGIGGSSPPEVVHTPPSGMQPIRNNWQHMGPSNGEIEGSLQMEEGA